MINLAEVLSDPDLCSPFQIIQQYGAFAAGGWQVQQALTINAYGAVRNTSGRELTINPEFDWVTEVLSFRSATEIYVTHEDYPNRISDILVYQGNQFRVLKVQNYTDQGFSLAYAARLPKSMYIVVPPPATGQPTPLVEPPVPAKHYHYATVAGVNATSIKSSAGSVLGWNIPNTSQTEPFYVHLHDTAGIPTVGQGVVYTIMVQAGVPSVETEIEIDFTYGIGMTITKNISDTDTTPIAGGESVLDIAYQ